MSGGSFNYLYGEVLTPHASELRQMADALRELGYHDLARETESFVAEPPESLRKVWKAVEWWQSCDWSKEQAAEVARAHDSLHPVQRQASGDGFTCRCGRFFSGVELARAGRRFT